MKLFIVVVCVCVCVQGRVVSTDEHSRFSWCPDKAGEHAPRPLIHTRISAQPSPIQPQINPINFIPITSGMSAREPAAAVARKGAGAMKARATAGSSSASRKSRRAIASVLRLGLSCCLIVVGQCPVWGWLEGTAAAAARRRHHRCTLAWEEGMCCPSPTPSTLGRPSPFKSPRNALDSIQSWTVPPHAAPPRSIDDREGGWRVVVVAFAPSRPCSKPPAMIPAIQSPRSRRVNGCLPAPVRLDYVWMWLPSNRLDPSSTHPSPDSPCLPPATSRGHGRQRASTIGAWPPELPSASPQSFDPFLFPNPTIKPPSQTHARDPRRGRSGPQLSIARTTSGGSPPHTGGRYL